MARLRLISSLLVGGAVLAPLFAFGHGMEFLVAKLEVAPGAVRLEITADYGGNPIITDETAARQAILKILRVGDKPLEELAPLKFEKRREWDEGMPAAQEGKNHELLTGVWNWEPDRPELTFGVPDGSPNDVLLWAAGDRLPGKDVRWTLLIEGESSPVIRVPRRHSRMWLWLPVALFGVAGWAIAVQRRRTGRAAESFR